jgi:hypothetical protein
VRTPVHLVHGRLSELRPQRLGPECLSRVDHAVQHRSPGYVYMYMRVRWAGTLSFGGQKTHTCRCARTVAIAPRGPVASMMRSRSATAHSWVPGRVRQRQRRESGRVPSCCSLDIQRACLPGDGEATLGGRLHRSVTSPPSRDKSWALAVRIIPKGGSSGASRTPPRLISNPCLKSLNVPSRDLRAEQRAEQGK